MNKTTNIYIFERNQYKYVFIIKPNVFYIRFRFNMQVKVFRFIERDPNL